MRFLGSAPGGSITRIVPSAAFCTVTFAVFGPEPGTDTLIEGIPPLIVTTPLFTLPLETVVFNAEVSI